MMTIGEAARRTGIKISTLRFYEQEGLLAPLVRTDSGRRLYAASDVQRLCFVKNARTLGFDLTDIRSLLDLADHPERSCEDALEISRRHLAEVKTRLAQLAMLEKELSRMARMCAGGSAAQCRVIEALAQTSVVPPHILPRPKVTALSRAANTKTAKSKRRQPAHLTR